MRDLLGIIGLLFCLSLPIVYPLSIIFVYCWSFYWACK